MSSKLVCTTCVLISLCSRAASFLVSSPSSVLQRSSAPAGIARWCPSAGEPRRSVKQHDAIVYSMNLRASVECASDFCAGTWRSFRSHATDHMINFDSPVDLCCSVRESFPCYSIVSSFGLHSFGQRTGNVRNNLTAGPKSDALDKLFCQGLLCLCSAYLGLQKSRRNGEIHTPRCPDAFPRRNCCRNRRSGTSI